jgi:hypothetical protein
MRGMECVKVSAGYHLSVFSGQSIARPADAAEITPSAN